MNFKVIVLLILLFFININTASAITTGLYTGTSWDITGAYSGYPMGITMNDSYFWIADSYGKVFQYHHNGTHTNVNWSTEGLSPLGLTINDTYIWTLDSIDKEIYQHYHNGTYTGVHFDIAGSGASDPISLTMDNTYFYVLDYIDKKAYKYYHDGTYTNDYIDVSSGNTWPRGIVKGDDYTWVVGGYKVDNPLRVYKYYHSGAYTTESWNITESYPLGTGEPHGITKNESYFWITDITTFKVYQYHYNSLPVTTSLYTEHQINPTAVSINASGTYFSWTYSDANFDVQSSYEIYVGTSSGASDMWNAQISSSDPYTNYEGTTLEEITTYYIQVRTNDGYENSDWVTGTFALKDTTAYSPPPTSGDTSPLDIYSEKISTPVIITEKITDTFAETDSLTFILYLVGALLGALIFGIITNNGNMINVVLTGTVGWVATLVAVVINNLLEIVVIDSIIIMILSVFFGFIIYVIYDQYTKENTKSKPKRRPKK